MISIMRLVPVEPQFGVKHLVTLIRVNTDECRQFFARNRDYSYRLTG